ncbi:hypothetical protein AMPH_23198 [Acinetobacter baumannii]|nr:hypothetical protein AMPH_23198 [Acinetobacter baumannii]
MYQIPIQMWNQLANFVSDPEDQLFLQLDQEMMNLRLQKQSEMMEKLGYSETVILAYQKVMMQVYLASEIQEMNLQMEIVEPVLTGLTAAEAVNYLVRDHLLNEQEIDQLYNLLNQLELP